MASINPTKYDSWWVELNVYFRTTDVRVYDPERVQIDNMNLFYDYFINLGWTANCIAGMLGNIMVESSVNPWRFQHNYLDWSDPAAIMTDTGGMGLTQWTPCDKYYSWALSENLDPKSGNSMCDRIKYEHDNNLQWSMDNYGQHTWNDFVTSTETPEILARVFLWAYERPAQLPTPEQEAERLAQRQANARWVFENIFGKHLNPVISMLLNNNNKRKVAKRPCRRM